MHHFTEPARGTATAPQHETWQLTRAEFIQAVREGRDFPRIGNPSYTLATLRGARDYTRLDALAAEHHTGNVTIAAVDGYLVPDHVLADYPHLKPVVERLGYQITDEDFATLDWPAQSQVLRNLNNLSCAQEGRTYGEAQRKRAPIDKRAQELRYIHDKQLRDWIANGSLQEPSALGEPEQLDHDELGDATEEERPGMR